MEFGAHLPLIGFDETPWTLSGIGKYVVEANRLGFGYLCANDHLNFPRPWLDGPTALAATLPQSEGMKLATTVSIPVVRGPAQMAKSLAAIDLLSGGRLIIGVGPGSSPRDYELAGVPFEERWKRLDESIVGLRAAFSGAAADYAGSFYRIPGVGLEPFPIQRPAPPIWIGSWGSVAGLRRVARLGDGWLASGYNATPSEFKQRYQSLGESLESAGRPSADFPNAIATMFFHITGDRSQASRILEQVLSPTIGRPVEELEKRLPVGSAAHAIELLSEYREAGAQRIYLWPVTDDLRQLETFAADVAPLLKGPR